MQLRENHRPIVFHQPRRAADHLRLRAFDVNLDEPHRPPDLQRVQRDERNVLALVTSEWRAAVPQQIRTARVERLRRKRERGRARRRAGRRAMKEDAIAKPVFGDRSLEEVRVGIERLEGVDPSGGPDHRRHLHREEPDVAADVDRGIALPDYTPHEADFVLLVLTAQDVQADHVIRQIDEQPHAGRDFLDHDRRIVRMGEVGIPAPEFGRGHQVMPKLFGVPRARELGADHVLVLGIAIEQDAVGPDDVIAGQPARVVRRHGPRIVPSTPGL